MVFHVISPQRGQAAPQRAQSNRKKFIRRTSPKPPSVAEEFLSANLGVFGVFRREIFLIVLPKIVLLIYGTSAVLPRYFPKDAKLMMARIMAMPRNANDTIKIKLSAPKILKES
jgi:hypothetical protein